MSAFEGTPLPLSEDVLNGSPLGLMAEVAAQDSGTSYIKVNPTGADGPPCPLVSKFIAVGCMSRVPKLPPRILTSEGQDANVVGDSAAAPPSVVLLDPGGNCIKIGLPGKSILGDY